MFFFNNPQERSYRFVFFLFTPFSLFCLVGKLLLESKAPAPEKEKALLVFALAEGALLAFCVDFMRGFFDIKGFYKGFIRLISDF